MGLSNDIRSYEDLRPHLDRALQAKVGVAIEAATHGQAVHLRHRLYHFRTLDRLASQELYEVGDERRGVSIYDSLSFSCVGNVVELRHAKPIKVFEL